MMMVAVDDNDYMIVTAMIVMVVTFTTTKVMKTKMMTINDSADGDTIMVVTVMVSW